MSINVKVIRDLREETGAGVLEVKQALETAGGDIAKAKQELMKKISSKAAKKADRTAGDGLVYAYIHAGGKVGSLVLVGCETDFVSRTDDFKNLCKEIAMQICTDDYKDVEELNNAEYIKDAGKTIRDLVHEVTAKTGEKVEIKNFVKLSI